MVAVISGCSGVKADAGLGALVMVANGDATTGPLTSMGWDLGRASTAWSWLLWSGAMR